MLRLSRDIRLLLPQTPTPLTPGPLDSDLELHQGSRVLRPSGSNWTTPPAFLGLQLADGSYWSVSVSIIA